MLEAMFYKMRSIVLPGMVAGAIFFSVHIIKMEGVLCDKKCPAWGLQLSASM